jgi:DNA recombination protein RmuC
MKILNIKGFSSKISRCNLICAPMLVYLCSIVSLLALMLLLLLIVRQKLKLVDYLLSLERELKHALCIKNEEVVALKIKNAELEVTLQKEREGKTKEMELFTKSEERLVNTFKALSLDALQANNNNFLDLAKEVIDSKLKDTDKNLEKRQTTLNEVIAPIKEKLEKFDHEIRALEKERVGAYEGLREQIGALMNQTSNLANALRKPHVRGKWGEMQLKRVVEMAGMIEYCDFVVQPTTMSRDNESILRPDLIIRMPSGKQIIIDAKVPLDSYLDAVSQSDLTVQKEKLKEHALIIKKHVNELGRKEYWNQFKNTPEFVVMFLMGEGVFSAALDYEPALIEIGVERKVIIATPITLIALLRAIAYGWKQEVVAESAKKISELGHTLYERMCSMGENFNNLRKSLKNAVDNFNKTAGSLEARVFPVAREFNKLGIDTKSKKLEATRELETVPRNLHVKELQDS